MTPLEWQAELVRVGVPDLLDVRAGRSTPAAVSVVTGGGKTYGMALLLGALRDAGEMPERVVVATSRLSLVDDIIAALRLVFGLSEIGEWSGLGKRAARIVVTTYASLGACLEACGCDLLFCDEAHRSGAEGAAKLVMSVPWRFGVSATLYRGDKGATIPGFDRVLMRVGWDEAVEKGWIVDYDHRLLTRAAWERVSGEGDVRALSGALAMIEEMGGPGKVGPILFLAPDGATAELMARIATEAGVRTRAIGMGNTRREREEMIADHRFGQIDALITVDLLTEGVNMPWLRVVALTAIVGSDVKIAQIVGRGCRALRFSDYPEAERFGPKVKMLLLDPACQFHPGRLGKVERIGVGGAEISRLPKDPAKRAAMAIGRLDRLPLAVAVEPIGQWSAALRDLALRASSPEWRSLPGHRPMLGETERAFPATRKQWVEAARRLQACERSIEPKEQREALRLIVGRGQALVTGGGLFEAPMDVGRGVASDLLIFLSWVAGRHETARKSARNVVGQAQHHHIQRARIMATARVTIPDSILLPGEVASDREEEGSGARGPDIHAPGP